MPQCVSEMVQVSNFYLQRGAAKILNKALLKFGRKPTSTGHVSFTRQLQLFVMFSVFFSMVLILGCGLI